jgi:excisionase family DNA binding protein
MGGNGFLTTRQAADLLGVTAPTVIKWVEAGRIEAHRTPGGHRRISGSEVKRFASSCGFELEGIPTAKIAVSSRTRVLIVDREADFAEMIAEYLELKGGFEVAHAASAIEAGYFAGLLQPEILVYDEDTTAIELPQLLKVMPSARVILVTSMRSTSTEALQAQVGAIHVVEKPVKLDRLLALIQEA